MGDLIAVLDLGGTKVSANVASAKGQLLIESVTHPVPSRRPADEILETIVSTVEQALGRAGVGASALRGIGIGAPGPLDAEHGILLTPPNLPTLHYAPLAHALAQRFGVRTLIESDGNLFSLGEARFGEARGYQIVLGITLGTGYGNGIVIQGRIFRGATGTAGEAFCSPYRGGIVDDYVTGRALERFYRERSGKTAAPPVIAERARDGELTALSAFKAFGTHNGKALAHQVNVLDPSVVVIGGSLAHQWDLFGPRLKEILRSHINPRPREALKVLPTRLFEKANLLGAASLFIG